jgi:hypothetical protein
LGCCQTGVGPVSRSYARPLSTVRRAFTPGFILPCRVASSELLRARFRLVRRPGRLPGFRSLFTTSPTRVHDRGASQGHRFVPSTGVLSLSTVCSALGFAGLFHPAAASRVRSRSGVSLSVQPPFLVGRSSPHTVGEPPLIESTSDAHDGPPRFRGLDPHRVAFLRVGV